MHHRLSPKRHRFSYKVFLFYLDLDELGTLHRNLRWMSRNRFNLFNFRDKDHLQLPRENPDPGKDVRAHLNEYLLQNGVELGQGRVMLLTNLCTLGYQFNPVSFYFCYDEAGEPLCAVVEVCNTYREMKLYFMDKAQLEEDRFHLHTPKYFYVSPFTDMDTSFHFSLGIPGDKLDIRIDDFDQQGRRFFISTLGGSKAPLTDGNLLKFFFSFPLITLKVIGAIHWQALKLWLKKLPYHKKADHAGLQREVYRPYKS
jgi:DUF1365 family protein